MWNSRTILTPSLVLALFCYSAFAAEISTEGLEHFEKRIRPLLVENCYQCHSADAEKVKGGLLLDTSPRTRRGKEILVDATGEKAGASYG